jgi:DNA-binding CsgD family transcriptional regulator
MKPDSTLLSLIENFPVSASLKEAETGRYVITNAYNAQQFGIDNPADLIGLTIHDLNFRQSQWGIEYAKAIEKLDFLARENKTHMLGRHRFLDDSGEARLEEMVKFPVLGSRRNILGIVTYRHDVTPTLPPIQLYQLHRSFYEPSSAISRVLAYLNLEPYFIAKATEAQFKVFLLKAERLSNKEAARFLGLSDRTVESHLAALRSKVVDGNLARVLSLVKWNTVCPADPTRC